MQAATRINHCQQSCKDAMQVRFVSLAAHIATFTICLSLFLLSMHLNSLTTLVVTRFYYMHTMATNLTMAVKLKWRYVNGSVCTEVETDIEQEWYGS